MITKLPAVIFKCVEIVQSEYSGLGKTYYIRHKAGEPETMFRIPIYGQIDKLKVI